MKNDHFLKQIGFCLLAVFLSCNHLHAKETLVVPGAVLEPGQSIEATNKFGTVKISYIAPLKRKFEWDGQSRVLKMIRGQEDNPEPTGIAHPEAHGMYNPADVWFFSFYDTRLVVGEYTYNFHNIKDIYSFLYEGSAVSDWVYTSDGLVVGYGYPPSKEAVNIDVYQLLLNGKKPTNLRGARNNQIKLIAK